MKKKNTAKKFGIISLCLMMIFSAFSGLSSLFTKTAVAGTAETVALSDWITASQGATIAKESRTVYLKSNKSQGEKNCLRVSSDVAYEATFNRVFQNNTELRFAFPERKTNYTTTSTANNWGNFKFRVADAMDPTNGFDLVYYKTSNGTTLRVEWEGNTIQGYTNAADAANYITSEYFYNASLQTVKSANVSPSLLGYTAQSYGAREGKLQLTWKDDVLYVITNHSSKEDKNDSFSTILAKFDGTYDVSVGTKNNFANKSRWGLPKMSFPNGYTISFSSNVTNAPADVTDKGTDVSFWKITSDGTTYTFDNSTPTKDNYMEAYDRIKTSSQANAGKALLGWKDAQGALHSTAELVKSTATVRLADCTPVYLGFDTINGASIRIDTSTNATSGIRFQTVFNTQEYLAAKSYIDSFGTLIGYKDSIIAKGKIKEGYFNTLNYVLPTSDEEVNTLCYQAVPNTKGVFNYTDSQGTTYKAYAVSVIGVAEENYTKEYTAIGYIVVKYADETTQTFYTDYSITDNSRSIAQTAYNLKQLNRQYATMTDAQKAVVDGYASAYVV